MHPKQSTMILLSSGPDATPKDTPACEATPERLFTTVELSELFANVVKDKQTATLIALVAHTKDQWEERPLSLNALKTAVAVLEKSDFNSLGELDDCRPQWDENSFNNDMGKLLKIDKRRPDTEWEEILVDFADESIKDYYLQEQPQVEDGLRPENLKLALARGCITYLAVQDFTDLPLPSGHGHRYDLKKSDKFLSYAASNWHKDIQSVKDAQLIEPALDKIIDPSLNNLYLWVDQSYGGGGSGPRHMFRNRAEVAIKYNFRWLADHILNRTSGDIEDVFPARDLASIAKHAPKILQMLIKREPGYYLPSVNKKVLMESLCAPNDVFESIQALVPAIKNATLPSAFLNRAATNKEGNKILGFLFDLKPGITITHGLLSAAATNDYVGKEILELCFQKQPTIRVDDQILGATVFNGNIEVLRVLLDFDPNAHVSEDMLVNLARGSTNQEKFQVIFEAQPNLIMTEKVVTAAVKQNRTKMVKVIFERYEDFPLSEKLMIAAAGSEGHSLLTAEFILGLKQWDRALINPPVLEAAIGRSNSAHKMTKLMLEHALSTLIITDEFLVQSKKDWDGEVLNVLLERRGGNEVPTEIVDHAVYTEKCRLGWRISNWDSTRPSLLNTLKTRVPKDPYLMKVLAKTDFTPQPEDKPKKVRTSTAIPAAAEQNNITLLTELLDQGLDINHEHGQTCGCDKNHGIGTALQRSVNNGNLRTTKFLLERGADPNLQHGKYGNPLQTAIKAGDYELTKLLLEYKAKIDHEGGKYSTPLAAAARVNDVKLAKLLLDNGADINIADHHGWTPYLHAIAHESHQILKFFSALDISLQPVGELIALPPTKLLKPKDKERWHPFTHEITKYPSKIGISVDGLTVTTTEVSEENLKTRVQLRADHPIIPILPFYFEMKIVEAAGNGVIGIGVCTSSSQSTGLPGWDDNSWGYHGDDGHAFEEGDRLLVTENPKYGTGDTVGCGVDFVTRTVWFTCNGRRLETVFYMVTGRLYPCVGVGDRGTVVTLNFGEDPFVYQG